MATRAKKTKARKQNKCAHKFEIIEEGDDEVPDVCSDTCSQCEYQLTMQQQRDMAFLDGVFPEGYNRYLMND